MRAIGLALPTSKPLHTLYGLPGTEMFEGERFIAGFDRSRGLVEEASQVRDGFVLTSHRLIYTGGGAARRTGCASLSDVQFMEVAQRPRNTKSLAIAAGLVLGGVSMLTASAIDPFAAITGAVLKDSSGLGSVTEIVSSTLGGIGQTIANSLRLGGVGMLLLAPLAFFYFLVSGETTMGTSISGREIRVLVSRSKQSRAQAFIQAFFRCKGAKA